ncbi:BrnA antitoxin family protein [Aestuariibius insulae]|uniref:BrnA antitoxin family protein n=1 Tax=Aestuariibius insulae TaxID=2058287 RepID=UPI00345EAA01
MSKRKSYIAPDGDASELDADFFKDARPGRPALPEEDRKQRVTLYLDKDVVARLKEDGKGWTTRANARLREVLGL